ncbi:beta-ketoacyl-ACP synthase II [Lactiplantibacillus mudanjiangensis]|uniref:3-oxoacyl-[acyl-carrier-protein] synthase 2 n=1 Tax=Lactiplantibacillus mudanjiangensis TaxID=1296538 RepID=A0A660EAC7_9LACO|nr:beta-ketoacyl-ACP synthase II [Lactiplantibacillus mudanjiangensis]VDG24176.1 3-oxoacyl-[acyl-carrier-protein] synthase 2 [Lactobacillus plantarum ZJ316] [Lactiplantibacillus mudanjiangensis]VDG30157.1 3-oxoacyl-[acyl-carrier-protein] synthase 2 [Lactobacillus plantarum ZJ316] [Lactiplantibacillus mudanjiangensis]VDG30641.1 3-oxoacyl-[acyl-carrier-protein] synthase 2 [Lactobacillus plantarum ZJ316] [Lactiplantibacillus mudanjiangensis]
MTQPRVVVTGMGAVTPLGNDVTDFLTGIFAGQVGINPITKFDATATGITVAGEVNGFQPEKRLAKKLANRLDLFSTYGLYSADEAMTQAGLTAETIDPERLGVIYGSGIGGLTTIEEQVIKMHDKSPKRVSPLFVPNAIVNMVAGNIAMQFNAQNTSQAIVTACASATNAIGDAFEYLRQGKADAIITGGSEASVNQIGIAGFAALTALSKATDPMQASLPFDSQRQGFVMGEGAGTLVLETLDHAQQRGATILAEIVGYGTTSDAYHMTAPRPDGAGAKRAMQQAIDEAGITPAAVDYINAHGTATAANDSAEAQAIASLFAANESLKVSSTKGMTGHLLGAAGAIEAIATVGALQQGRLPVNVGVTQQDPACPVTLVDEANQQTAPTYALSNSFGFGGHNAVVAFKKWVTA